MTREIVTQTRMQEKIHLREMDIIVNGRSEIGIKTDQKEGNERTWSPRTGRYAENNEGKQLSSLAAAIEGTCQRDDFTRLQIPGNKVPIVKS